MSRSLTSLLHTAAFAAVVLAAGDASAFCRTTTCDPSAGDTCRKNSNGCVRDGVPLRWPKLPIVYRFSRKGSAKLGDDSKARGAIRAAFDKWTEVQCEHGKTSLVFKEDSDITTDKPLNQKQASQPFGIYFRDDSWPHDDADESIALTNQIYGKITGNIDYADIEINTAMVTFSLSDENRDDTDLQSVITHEVGHYIGLAHSNQPESIMVARYCQSSGGSDRCKGGIDRARDLADDDRTALCSAYGPLDANANPPKAFGSCAVVPSPHMGHFAALFGLMCAATAIVRRRLTRR